MESFRLLNLGGGGGGEGGTIKRSRRQLLAPAPPPSIHESQVDVCAITLPSSAQHNLDPAIASDPVVSKASPILVPALDSATEPVLAAASVASTAPPSLLPPAAQPSPPIPVTLSSTKIKIRLPVKPPAAPPKGQDHHAPMAAVAPRHAGPPSSSSRKPDSTKVSNVKRGLGLGKGKKDKR